MPDDKLKFLVLGCNGMAGHLISVYLQERGYEVFGFARGKSSYIKTIIGDATDSKYLKDVIEKGQFDSVVNCIGVLNKFAELDRASAVYLNGYLPNFLAKITENTKTQIIQISTDCVFSGKTGGYTESSTPDGTSFYDRTKSIGELEDLKNITLRNSIVGPDIKKTGIGLLNWFLLQDGNIKGYRKAMWTGQTTLQLAKTVELAAKEKAHGLFNTVPKYSISKYELLLLFNSYIRKTPIKITPDDELVVDKSLIRTRYEGFNFKIPDYEEMVSELGKWMRDHKSMYPHYNF